MQGILQIGKIEVGQIVVGYRLLKRAAYKQRNANSLTFSVPLASWK